jgi:hypothetical protein
MRHELVKLRKNYQSAIQLLRHCEQLNFSDETTNAFRDMCVIAKTELSLEIRRVAHKVWPNTGRPYIGPWQVVSRITKMPMVAGTLIRCIKYAELLRYGNVYIEKCPK